MDKSIYGREHRILAELLRSTREKAGLRQVDVAERLGWPQSAISKYESGERRLDLVELRRVCDALGVSVVALVTRFDRAART